MHIASSHRRDPHHTWKDALGLILDLLLGLGKDRYLRRIKLRPRTTVVNLRGFSAGSYIGVVTLRILQEMTCIASHSILEAIACPPKLLRGLATDQHQVHLVHFGADKLCIWNPNPAQLQEIGCAYTYVFGNSGLYPKHFGLFFLLRAARVPKGPGRFALQSAYHDPHLDVNELKQQIKKRFVQAKTCRIKQIT